MKTPYLKNFQFIYDPFTKETDGRQGYFAIPTQRFLLDRLPLLLRQHGGVFRVAGASGSGKSFVAQELYEKLRANEAVVRISSQQRGSIMASICHGFGLNRYNNQGLLEFVQLQNKRGVRVIILVDQAELLPAKSLSLLDELLADDSSGRLRLVLFSTRGLNKTLMSENMHHIMERTVFAYYLRPLSVWGSYWYLVHHIKQARLEGVPWAFSSLAYLLLSLSGKGNIELLNLLASQCLQRAFQINARKVNMGMALRVIQSLSLRTRPYLPLIWLWTLGGVGICFVIYLFMGELMWLKTSLYGKDQQLDHHLEEITQNVLLLVNSSQMPSQKVSSGASPLLPSGEEPSGSEESLEMATSLPSVTEPKASVAKGSNIPPKKEISSTEVKQKGSLSDVPQDKSSKKRESMDQAPVVPDGDPSS